MHDLTNQRFWKPIFDNNVVDALIPEVWAQEALMVLEAKALAANMVYRDFEDTIQQFGDTVNAHRPAKRTARRKGYDDDVVSDAAEVENVPVVLNQHIYNSFIIKDGEESKAFKSLVDLHLVPAIESINQAIDLLVLTQLYHFMGNAVGKLGTAVDKAAAIAIETKCNQLHMPYPRWGLITAQQKGEFSNVEAFTSAEKIGDDGSAIREGSLGKLFGTNWTLADNAPSIAAGNTVSTTAITTAGAAAGATSIPVTAFTTEHDGHVGGWLTVAGDMTPQKIIAVDAGNNELDISPGLKTAVVDTAAVTIYVPGALTSDYAVDYLKHIAFDGFTVAPQQGQLISLSDATTPEAWGTQLYGSLQGPTTTAALLDVPIQAAVENNDLVGIGPAGQYGFVFHPEAIALVTRPLAQPREGTGAQSYVASYNGLSIRVVITYDGVKQGHRVTVDMLCGIKVLDTDLGVPLFS